MNKEGIRELVIRKLTGIAPEVDPARIVPDVDLRAQVDLDSMDFLNFIIALSREIKVDIPESEYSRMSTLDACIEYLSKKVESKK
ncbi:MAG: acyl carrier protein [Acidobacteriota bacterium]|nr:MAG: acyl carrier protein [Acidobacteriota bacterium]